MRCAAGSTPESNSGDVTSASLLSSCFSSFISTAALLTGDARLSLARMSEMGGAPCWRVGDDAGCDRTNDITGSMKTGAMTSYKLFGSLSRVYPVQSYDVTL